VGAEVERKLAAILSADVAGYSRLMAEDESETVRRLGAYRTEVTHLVADHRGRLVDFTGDNFLAEFPTATDAVEAAAEIQRVIKARNAAVPAGRAMEFRIGVHLGEVRVEEERLYGDGVNIAARLEGLADPGGTCISGTVLEQIRRKLELDFDDLGEQTVKNIPDPVRAYLLRERAAEAPAKRTRGGRWGVVAAAAVLAAVVATAYVMMRNGTPTPTGAPLTSIAVLPFDDMSPEGDQGWLADGMAEELIEMLSRIEQLRVIARTSTFAFKGEKVDIREVGQNLGVGSVVEGSVRRSGDQLRVTAQLIRVEDGTHLWSARYDRRLDDVFAIQGQIAREVAEAVRTELGVEDAPSWMQGGRYAPRDVRAYELVRKSSDLMWAFHEEGVRRAIDLCLQAIEIDPDYSEAHNQLGWAYYALWRGGYDRSEKNLSKARAAATRAHAINENDGISLLAQLSMQEWKWEDAERRLVRAIELAPRNGGPRLSYAMLLLTLGRVDAAADQARRATELDPLWPIAHSYLGFIHLVAGDYDAAIERLERGVELNPQVVYGTGFPALAYHMNGMDAEALDAAVRGIPPELEGALRGGYEADGWRGMCRAWVEALVAQTGRPCTRGAGYGAALYAWSGDVDRMYGCLEESLAEESGPFMLALKVNPTFAPYRDDPRFIALLRRMGLEE
jgi:adenylate cyclase